MDTIRKSGRAPLLLSTAALVIAVVGTGGPALAKAVINADKVDGKNAVGAGATPAQRKGKLVATNSAGQLPANLIPKALNADKLDGVDSSALLTKAAVGSGGSTNSAGNPVSWSRLKEVPYSLIDGDAGDGDYRSTQYNGSITANSTQTISTFGWPKSTDIRWYAEPTSNNDAILTTSVAIQSRPDGTFTYYVTVQNTNAMGTNYALRYVARYLP
jgi:hypothetical protein